MTSVGVLINAHFRFLELYCACAETPAHVYGLHTCEDGGSEVVKSQGGGSQSRTSATGQHQRGPGTSGRDEDQLGAKRHHEDVRTSDIVFTFVVGKARQLL